MPHNCGNCGSQTTRSRTTVDVNGDLHEQCPSCGLVVERFSDPSDKKIYSGEQFDPTGYEWRDGKRVLTEERQADIMHELSMPDKAQERAKRNRIERMKQEKRAANVRTTPSTRDEIDAADRIVRRLREKQRVEQS